MRDIAGVAKDDQAKMKAVRVSKVPMKRPTGMNREVFNLIAHGPNEETLLTSVPAKKFKSTVSLNRKVMKWVWKEFENGGRSDGFKLKHWEREDRNPNEPYIFARMNKHVELEKPTEEEYEKCLQADKWTYELTTELFNLCERFDLRWHVVYSRFDKESGFSLEDLKERFYKVLAVIKRERGNDAQPHAFDVDNERKRKEQLEILWNRTDEEIKEEQMLKAQIKRIESKRKEREKRTQDLQRLISVVERSASPEPNGNHMSASTSQGTRERRRQQKQQKTHMFAAHLFSNEIPNLRFSEFKTAGPHLRTQEMKLPSNVGQKKLKSIEEAIKKYDLPYVPPAHEEIVKLYNEFRARVVLVQELRNAIQGTQ